MRISMNTLYFDHVLEVQVGDEPPDFGDDQEF